MKIRLRWKNILFFLIGMVVLGGGVHLLHGKQVHRNDPAILEQAKRMEETGALADAGFFYRTYLRRVPDDLNARVRFMLLRVKLARTPKEREEVYFGLEEMLRNHPELTELRRETVTLAMQVMGRPTDARTHLDALLKEKPKDPELELLYARCLLFEKRFADALTWLQRVREHAPQQLEGYVLAAVVLREQMTQAAEADQILEQMVKTMSSAEAPLARAAFRKKFGKPEDAALDIEEARKRAPENADVLLAVAQLEQERKKFAEARTTLNRGTELYPKDVRFHSARARLEDAAGQRAEGIASLRAGLKTVPESAVLLWDLAIRLTEKEQAAEVGQLITRLRKARVPDAQLQFLEARALVSQGRWVEASGQLDRLHPLLQPWPELALQADLLLGTCYSELGNTDQRYAAYQRAVKADPLSVPACLGLGGALERLGRADEAIEVYKRIVPRAPQARLLVAQLLIAQNLALAPSEQRWQPVEQVIAEAEKSPGPITADELALIRAQTLLAQKKPADAAALLNKAREKNPDKADLWIAQSVLAEREKHPEVALKLLDEAEKKFGDRLDLRLARAAYWARREEQGSRHLPPLAQNVDHFTVQERRLLWRGLADAHLRVGEKDQAAQFWGKLAEELPNDLGTRIVLFDLSILRNDMPAARHWASEISRIEGMDGTFWRYARACELVIQARGGDRSGVEEARKLLGEVSVRRPAWSRVALCEAELALVLGDRGLAITKYQKAVTQGERAPDVLRRLVELLSEQRRYDDANRVLQLLPEQTLVLGKLQRLAAEVSWQSGDRERALKLAEKVIAQDSKDYRDHLWLGQMLWAAQRPEEAEKRIRHAVKLAEAEPAPWIALVQYLVRTGKKEEATALLAQARGKIDPKRVNLALAQCQEALGQIAEATKLYTSALKENASDPAILRNVVNFYLRTGDLSAAEPLLESLVARGAAEDGVWAKRTLALVLALQGNREKTRRAMQLLGLGTQGGSAASGTDSSDDLRVRALVLAAEGSRADRLRAIRLLEDLAGRQPLTKDDQFLLGQLHETVGDWGRARDRMVSLVSSNADNPFYLARYIRSLLRHNNPDQAALWVEKLARIQPDAFQTIELKCRVLHAQKQGEKMVPILESHLQRKEGDLLRVAALLDQLGQPRAAEGHYRRWVQQAKQPEAVLVLAQFLGRQNRLREALDLCEEARKTCRPEAIAAASIGVLYAAETDQRQIQRVEGWFTEMTRKDPKNAALWNTLGSLRNLQGNYPEAIRLYRAALALNPNDALAMNNLAYLLALKEGKGEEALRLLQQAMEVAGSLPDLLDTRAMILLALKRTEEATRALDELVTEHPGAVAYFHLAQTHLAARNRLGAMSALRKARELGLKPGDLHPLERPIYQALRSDLGVQ